MSETPKYTYVKDSKGRSVAVKAITCEQCGNPAVVRAHATGRFCSKSCAALWRHAHGTMPAPVRGTEAPGWKGDDASYSAMHKRVLRLRGKADHCEQREAAGCHSLTFQWAHIHGTGPGDPANYRQLCRECHVAYDDQLGEGNAHAKLTQVDADTIRTVYAAGGTTYKALAERYEVTMATISNIVLQRRYRS